MTDENRWCQISQKLVAKKIFIEVQFVANVILRLRTTPHLLKSVRKEQIYDYCQ